MTADAERLVAIQARRALVPDVLSWMDVGPSRIDGFARPDQRAADVRRRAQVNEFIAHAPEDIGYLLTVAAERDERIATGIEILTSEGVWLQREHAAVKALSGHDPAPEFGPRFDPIRSVEWKRLTAERDALQVRIEAATRVLNRWGAFGDGIARSVVDAVSAALAAHQPEATPEVAEMCDHYRGADEGCPAGCFATPEPPHLDPEPWVNRHAGTRQSDNRDGWREFDPRPADENGKAYSKNRADYEVQS